MAIARPSAGLRVTSNELGVSYAATTKSAAWPHAFRPLLSGDRIAFLRGVVDGRFEPKIGGVPMSGDATHAQPTLKLSASVANEAGESWVCLEVEPNSEGRLDADSRIELIHTIDTVSTKLTVGRVEVAMILWRDGSPIKALPILQFNPRYERFVPAAGGGPVRHFFR
jgi:hypothetical protein